MLLYSFKINICLRYPTLYVIKLHVTNSLLLKNAVNTKRKTLALITSVTHLTFIF